MKYYEILKDFDPNTNARDIVMFYINKFKKKTNILTFYNGNDL